MYTANLVVNSPIMAGVFRCKDCHMNFQTQQLLTKHKTKFCVGSASDPDDLQLRRGLRSTSPQRIISPDDKDDYRRNPNSDQQLRSLAENHGRQMEYLQLQNRDLEKQREEIRRRLENLGRRTVVPPQDNSADLLRELRDQEHRNQRALDDLKNQLMMMNREPKTQIIEVEKPVFPPQPPPPPPPPPEEPRRPIVLPVYYGKSLVAEINAIRQAYLQNGGNDPEVLSQMAQMQAEAQAIEDQMNQKPEKPREKPKDNNQTFNLLEMENERLIQELRLLQEQNTLARNRRNSDKEDELERELRRLQREHLEKMYGLQKDVDDLRMLLMMERNRPPPPPPPQTVIQQAPQPPVSLKPYVEVEPMAPYDQYPNNYVPAYHHGWNLTQFYATTPVSKFPEPRPQTLNPGPLRGPVTTPRTAGGGLAG